MRINWIHTRIGLLWFGITIPQAFCADNDLLNPDDLWVEDGFELSTEPAATAQSAWQGFKGTLQHTQMSSDQGTLVQRSEVRMEYEHAIANGWFLRLDGRYQYFDSQDFMAKANASHARTQMRQAWLQYTQGDCAVKVGKQNLIWGEVEGAFVVDVISPFDYSEPLFTDFSQIRRAQNMAVLDCFATQSMWQFFYNPDAKLDQFADQSLNPSLTTGPEYGVKYKHHFTGWDLSVMAAHLYANTPSMNANYQMISGDFDMLALSSSIALGRFLYKWDLAFKTQQLINGYTATTNRLDVAIGFEYTSAGNHRFNLGVWGGKALDDTPENLNESAIITGGWSQTYWHDELAMSLLANYTDNPQFFSVTLQGDYQWNDAIGTVVTLGWAQISDEAAQLQFIQAEKSLTLSVKWMF